MSSQHRHLLPTAPSERIELLDVLRGFALLGILAVNMRYFSTPIYLAVAGGSWGAGPVDRSVDFLIHFFVEGKFYSLFSFLFGVGLALQMRRAHKRGTSFVPLVARRLGVLLLIGITHTCFLWFGDILVAYSILGFVLLCFRNRSDKTILVTSAVCLLFPVLVQISLYGLVEWGRSNPEMAAKLENDFAENHANYIAWTQQSYKVYTKGNYQDILLQRWKDVRFAYLRFLFQGSAFQILAMFLLGLWAGRNGIFQEIHIHLHRLRQTAPWLILVSLLANTVYVFATYASNPAIPSAMSVFKAAGFAVGAPSLCFVYAIGVSLLVQRKRWMVFAAVGRGALSNYLLQSVICSTLFYGYGFGLYGRWGPGMSLALAVTLVTAQVVLSNLWFRRHRFGPAEWLWRWLTYKGTVTG